MALIGGLLAASGCDAEPTNEVPKFTSGDGTGEASSDPTAGDEHGDSTVGGPVDGGPGDESDAGQGDDTDSGGGPLEGGPLDDDGSGDSDAGTTTGAPVEPLPFEPLYRVSVRVHAGASGLSDAELGDILAEMNHIWRSQSAVCFEFEVVADDSTMSEGFDMWFQPEVGGPNGYYAGDHEIYVRDQPNLNNAANPAMIGAARTAAHELGHGLNLSHDQNSDDYLMRSGTYGWEIPMYQIDASRDRAAQKALADTTLLDCAAAVFD
ncbi:MAG: hypothetical protein JKY37_03070 [Nannocystaceae bacterium]|nr:hypothetical protein [Nannocystaceae bacterium]